MASGDIIRLGDYVNTFGDGSDGVFNSSASVQWAPPSGLDDADFIVKNFSSFTLNSGHTITASKRIKGIWIRCTGNIVINGTIDVTTRSPKLAFATNGVPGYSKMSLKYSSPLFGWMEVVPIGGAGGNGGGYSTTYTSGLGGAAGAFGGSSGGSGACGGANGFSPISGVGGGTFGGSSVGTSAGSGIAGGVGGGGGAVYIFAQGTVTIGSTGQILANGANGGNATGGANGAGGGGGAGGGIIIILSKGAFSNSGSLNVNGGTGGTGISGVAAGSAGGAGTVIAGQIL